MNNLKLNTRWGKDPMLEHFQGEGGNASKGRILGKPDRNIYRILALMLEVQGLWSDSHLASTRFPAPILS